MSYEYEWFKLDVDRINKKAALGWRVVSVTNIQVALHLACEPFVLMERVKRAENEPPRATPDVR